MKGTAVWAGAVGERGEAVFLKLSLYVSVAWELLNTDKCIINVSMWQKTLFSFFFFFFVLQINFL